MTYALQDEKPGETVNVIGIRNDSRTTLKATLGTRGGTPSPEAGHGGAASAAAPPLEIKAGKPDEKTFDGERHFADIRQLTFSGGNAQPHFSPDGRNVIHQCTGPA